MKPQVSIKKKIYYLKQHSRFAYKSYINCKLWGQYTIFFLSYFSFKTAIKTVTYAKYFINCKNCSIFFQKKKKMKNLLQPHSEWESVIVTDKVTGIEMEIWRWKITKEKRQPRQDKKVFLGMVFAGVNCRKKAIPCSVNYLLYFL